MHGFYLRILQRHCRQIWGMNVELVDCEGLWEIKLPTEEGKATAKEIFDHGTASNLRNLKADSLRYLALQEGLDYRRNKKALADSLLQLRVVRQWQALGLQDMTRPAQDIPSPDHPSIPPTASLSMNQTSVDQELEAGQTPRQRDSSRAPQDDSLPSHRSSSVTASSNNKSSANQEFNAAHQAFLDGQPKTHFKKLSTETIQKLANLYGVHAFTPAGAPSRAKQTLIDALFKWKTESNVDRTSMNDTTLLRVGANPALPPLSTYAPIGAGPSAQNARVQGVSRSSTHHTQPGEPSRDEHLKLFLNATKSQIDHYPAKVLEGIVHAVKIWKKAAAGPRPHRNKSPRGDLSENQVDDFFETQSNGSLDYEPYDLDNYDEGDDRSDSSEEEVEIVIPSTNKGKRDLIHNIVRQLSFSIRFIDNHTFPIPQRFESGITSENGQLLNKAATRRSGVLGKDTLAAIREDMEKLRTPSWMAAAPNHPGEASQGKFTADQWRTFCTVNLPITLIRLWGSLPHEERRYEMLVNFMHLITSIRLADMRVMTEERIQTFERHYRAYLTGIIGFEMKDRLGGLYPHTRVTPYQHMMLHFGDLLRLFGPVHSWRCFAFERFNYILQTTKTNSRFGAQFLCPSESVLTFAMLPHIGELEKTMFTRFCMMQKLKSLFHGEAFPPIARELATLYQETFEDLDARGTRINDALAYEEPNSDTGTDWPVSSLTILDASTYHKVLKISTSENWTASVRIHGRFKQRGLTFTPQKRSFSDAQVVYHTGTAEEWSAGSIKRIFTTIGESKDGNSVGETFVEIHPYRSLTAPHAEYDDYRKFGFAGGRFFYDILEKETLLLPLEKISAHFAYSMQSHSLIDASIIHALPLNKVNFVLIICFHLILITFLHPVQESEFTI
ncbi:hypothetical protein F5879DRAFT_991862 [Lentinula edodes]|nr:hypothetical protein F5879DRAFT_991862 [Lentinula edodes]